MATEEVTSSVGELSIKDSKPSNTGLACCNCGQPATPALSCPVCKKSGIRTSIFCTPDCYKKNYATHKKLHVAAPVTTAEPAVPTEGVYDPFLSTPRFRYSGNLRAVYPAGKAAVPKRTVPEHIPRPDYALNSELIDSIPERYEGRVFGGVRGKAEEVARVVGGGLKLIWGESFSEKVSNRVDKLGKRLDKKEIEGMRKVCKLAREVLDIAAAAVRPGITTLEIDEIVHAECVKRNSYPSPLGYHLFPRSVCTSPNEVICHGIPDARSLVEGDIVNLDVTLFHEGFHGDINGTYPVGNISSENTALISAARECLDLAIKACKPGFLYRDLGEIIETRARALGFTVNHTYCGHGINQLFHSAPNVPHYTDNKARGSMKPGQTFTIEPMLCAGHQKETHWPDNWTAVTLDGKNSAQFEETMLITEDGVEVLTAAPGWKLP